LCGLRTISYDLYRIQYFGRGLHSLHDRSSFMTTKQKLPRISLSYPHERSSFVTIAQKLPRSSLLHVELFFTSSYYQLSLPRQESATCPPLSRPDEVSAQNSVRLLHIKVRDPPLVYSPSPKSQGRPSVWRTTDQHCAKRGDAVSRECVERRQRGVPKLTS
jgi:hypothetical protein